MKKLLLLGLTLTSLSLLGNTYNLKFTDEFKKIDGKYKVTVDPSGKKDTMSFYIDVKGNKVSIVKDKDDSSKAKISGDGSIAIDVGKQCKRFRARSAGAGIGAAIAAPVAATAALAVHIDLKIQAETGDLKGKEASLKIKSTDMPCKDHTFTISAEANEVVGNTAGAAVRTGTITIK